jgi:amino acid permease
MYKYSKEYCEKGIKEIRVWVVYCIIAIVLSIVCLRVRILSLGIMGDMFYVLVICGAVLFLWGAVIEIGKCKNILKELEQVEDKERVAQSSSEN